MSGLLALPLLRSQEPEAVLYNGNFTTLDQAQSQAQAVAISGGRFAAVGSNAEVLPLAGARRERSIWPLRACCPDSTTRTPIPWPQVSSICTKWPAIWTPS